MYARLLSRALVLLSMITFLFSPYLEKVCDAYGSEFSVIALSNTLAYDDSELCDNMHATVTLQILPRIPVILICSLPNQNQVHRFSYPVPLHHVAKAQRSHCSLL